MITLLLYLWHMPTTCPSLPVLPPLPSRVRFRLPGVDKRIHVDLRWLVRICWRLSRCLACIWYLILRLARFFCSFCVRWRPVAEATGRDTIEVRWQPPPLKDWIASKRRRSSARVTPFDHEAGGGRWFELTDLSESLQGDGGRRMMKVAVEASSGGGKASVTGLKPGSSHQFQVLAQDESGGRSKTSLISRGVQLPLVHEPLSALKVRPLSGTKIFVEWIEPQVIATAVGRYELSIRLLGDEQGWYPPAVIVALPHGIAPPLNTRRGGDDKTTASRAIVTHVDASSAARAALAASSQDSFISRLRGKQGKLAAEPIAAASKLSCEVNGLVSEAAEILPLQPGKGYYVRMRVWAEVRHRTSDI